MGGVYELTSAGEPPVTLVEAKRHAKVTTDADDDLASQLLLAATEYCERYSRRELRANQWTLTLDEFCPRILLRRDPVAAVDSVTRLVSGSPVAVDPATYYLKRGAQSSEVLLAADQEWPDDLDEVEGGVVVAFTTQPLEAIEAAKAALLRLFAWLYENRGDCEAGAGADLGEAARLSGAAALLDQFRVSRV